MRLRDQEIQDAVLKERARCLWCCEQVLKELRAKLAHRPLMSLTEETGRKIKLQIAQAVVTQLRASIVSGVGPRPVECVHGVDRENAALDATDPSSEVSP